MIDSRTTRDVFESPRRSNPIAFAVALLLTVAILGAIVWMTPSDDTASSDAPPVATTFDTGGTP